MYQDKKLVRDSVRGPDQLLQQFQRRGGLPVARILHDDLGEGFGGQVLASKEAVKSSGPNRTSSPSRTKDGARRGSRAKIDGCEEVRKTNGPCASRRSADYPSGKRSPVRNSER